MQLTLASADVIHSLYIPAFRAKKDVVPGRYNRMWFTPTKIGTYELFCSEYCGTLHSRMGAKVEVLSRPDFEAKMDEISDPYFRTDEETGEKVAVPFAQVGQQYHQNLCVSCHSVDGSAGTGPSWKGIYMAERRGVDGSVRVGDDEYIAESIWYPGRFILEGYGNAMPAFKSTLDERDLRAITAYIATLGDGYKADADGTVTGPGESTSLDGPSVEEDNAETRPVTERGKRQRTRAEASGAPDMATITQPGVITGVPDPVRQEPAVDNYLTYGDEGKNILARAWSWATTVDHKRIGLMYLFTVLTFFLIAGLAALLVRTELFTPGPTLRAGENAAYELYNHMFTMHGAIMTFLFIIPAIPAILGNFVLPIMLGAKDVAFPRLNLASYWIYALGAVFFLYILASGVPAGRLRLGLPRRVRARHRVGRSTPPTRPAKPSRPSSPRRSGRVRPRLQLDPDRAELHRQHPHAPAQGDDLVPHAAVPLGALQRPR